MNFNFIDPSRDLSQAMADIRLLEKVRYWREPTLCTGVVGAVVRLVSVLFCSYYEWRLERRCGGRLTEYQCRRILFDLRQKMQTTNDYRAIALYNRIASSYSGSVAPFQPVPLPYRREPARSSFLSFDLFPATRSGHSAPTGVPLRGSAPTGGRPPGAYGASGSHPIPVNVPSGRSSLPTAPPRGNDPTDGRAPGAFGAPLGDNRNPRGAPIPSWTFDDAIPGHRPPQGRR